MGGERLIALLRGPITAIVIQDFYYKYFSLVCRGHRFLFLQQTEIAKTSGLWVNKLENVKY